MSSWLLFIFYPNVKVAKAWAPSHIIISYKERPKQSVECSLKREPKKRYSILRVWAFNNGYVNIYEYCY